MEIVALAMIFLLISYILSLYFVHKYITKDIFSPLYPIILIIVSYIGALLFQSKIYDTKFNDIYKINSLDNIIFLSVIFILILPTIYVSKNFKNNIAHIHNHHFTKITKYTVLMLFVLTYILYFYVEFYSSGVYCPLCHMIKGDLSLLGIEKIHRYGKDSKLQLFISQLYLYAAYLILFYREERHKIWKFALLFLVFSVPIFGIIKTSKSDFILPLIAYAIIFYYTSENKQNLKKRLVLILTFTIVAGIYVTYLRVISLHGTYASLINYDTSGDLTDFDPFLFGYTVANVLNFFRYLNITDYSLWNNYIGLSFFRPIYTLLLQGDVFDNLNIDFHYLGPGATVGTYMRTIYLEGGILLLYLATLVYTLLINLVYYKLNKCKTTSWLLIYMVLYLPWFMLFFQNLFANLNIWFSIIIIMMINTFNKFTIKGKVNKNCIE